MKTVSLELAKQLREVGYPQGVASVYYQGQGQEIDLEKGYATNYKGHLYGMPGVINVAAPTADEILDLLPAFIADTFTLIVEKGPVVGSWTVAYRDEEYYKSKDKMFFSNSLADAAAKMYLYLKKEGLL